MQVCRTVLLACGHPVKRMTSFLRQLRLLADALGERHTRTVVVGSESLREAVEELKVTAAVLLGYPDQFPFLHCLCRAAIPVYLWAQFSRPPRPEDLRELISVPLTEITRIYLLTAGAQRLGPTIPHAVDTSVFRPAASACRVVLRRRFQADDFVVGAVGVNSMRKRFDRLLEGFSSFARKNARARLLIKTDLASKEGGFDLPMLINRLELGNRVSLVQGEQSNARMADLYRSMDVLAHVAEWEGFGIPAIEAMACGVPVVTHFTQGPWEIVPYPDLIVPGGRVVREGETVLRWVDTSCLAGVFERVAADPGLCRELGAQGREEVERRFSIDVVAREWRSVLSA